MKRKILSQTLTTVRERAQRPSYAEEQGEVLLLLYNEQQMFIEMILPWFKGQWPIGYFIYFLCHESTLLYVVYMYVQ